jgi:thiamine-phosphate pyrophosphorylase
MKQFDLSLYLVLDPDLCEPIGMVETTRLAVRGGVTMVQLRDKRASTVHMIETGMALKAALAGTGVPLIINDNVEAAVAIGADGIHVGQEDMSADEVRARVGKEMILGLSVDRGEHARPADPRHVDYVGVGPVFPTNTKLDHSPAIGFDGLAKLIGMSPLPAVAIGGIKAQHIGECLNAGAKGVAVVSTICGQPDPEEAARHLAQMIREVRR